MFGMSRGRPAPAQPSRHAGGRPPSVVVCFLDFGGVAPPGATRTTHHIPPWSGKTKTCNKKVSKGPRVKTNPQLVKGGTPSLRAPSTGFPCVRRHSHDAPHIATPRHLEVTAIPRPGGLHHPVAPPLYAYGTYTSCHHADVVFIHWYVCSRS